MKPLAAAAFLSLLLPSLASGQACPDPPPPYRLLRFDEDYGYLREERCRGGFWDAVKMVPWASDGERRLSFGGDARVRLENGRNVRFSPSALDPRNDVIQRYHVHADARLDAGVRAFVEVKTNQVWGRSPGPIPNDVDRADVHQAFVEVGPVRVGRQEFVYGAARRIFPRNGPNVRGSFDGVRVAGRLADWKVDGLAFQNVAADPGRFDDTSLHDQRFWGVYATGPAWSPFRADLYYLGADRDPARFVQGLARELRHTFGTRLFGRAGGWDFDIEPAVQSGRYGSASIAAWTVAGELGRAFAAAPLKPRVSLRFTAGSGDRDPVDPRLESFNSLSPRGGALGEVWNFSAANLRHLRLGVDLALSPAFSATIGADAYWRASLRDGVYGAGGNIVANAPASRARDVGRDVDSQLAWRLSRQLSLNASLGYFRNGAYSRDAGLGRRQWLVFPFVQLQF